MTIVCIFGPLKIDSWSLKFYLWSLKLACRSRLPYHPNWPRSASGRWPRKELLKKIINKFDNFLIYAHWIIRLLNIIFNHLNFYLTNNTMNQEIEKVILSIDFMKKFLISKISIVFLIFCQLSWNTS